LAPPRPPRRPQVYARLKVERSKEKRAKKLDKKKALEAALAAGQAPPPAQRPRTIDADSRKADATTVTAGDAEVEAEEREDEFAEHFNLSRPPKVLVTTHRRPSRHMWAFLGEFMEVLPRCEFAERRGLPLKNIVKWADEREFSDLLVFHESPGGTSEGGTSGVDGMMHVHLPTGPTARYALKSLLLSKDIPNCGRATDHRPELVLNGFHTRLGHRIGRMFASLWHQDPEFTGRRVCTMHNQRDFIFFRHHRYVFEEKLRRAKPTDADSEKQKLVKARLQELGPRFTLKLQTLQRGTFADADGEFEFVKKGQDRDSAKRFWL